MGVTYKSSAKRVPGESERKRKGGAAQTTAMRTILVVEDDADVRDAIQLILSLEGYDVMTAPNGAEGLMRAAERRPDLVISDIMMPVMNGFELCRRLRADPATRDIPIILHSSFIDPDAPLEPSWDAFMRKPVDVPALLREIDRLLARG